MSLNLPPLPAQTNDEYYEITLKNTENNEEKKENRANGIYKR
jgi:hypothetical protein